MAESMVSIIIPVYNGGKHLAQAVQSALDQTWNSKEILIVDDGSTDNSLEIAKGFKNEIIKIFEQTNKGASAARNKGLKEANGDYIQFLDADDFLSENKIEDQIDILSGSMSHLSFCETMYFYDDKPGIFKHFREKWYFKDWNNPVEFLLKLYSFNEFRPGFGGMIQPNAWLTPRKLIEKAGMWKEFKCPDDDGEFFCRVILASEGLKYSSNGRNFYRRYKKQNSLSGQKDFDAYNAFLESIELRYTYLKAITDDPIVDKIYAWQLWDKGVHSYPQFKELSNQCIEKAKKLGFTGRKYLGGPIGQIFAKFFGWQFARYLVFHAQAIKNRFK